MMLAMVQDWLLCCAIEFTSAATESLVVSL